jgi:hypothetical protein
VSGKRGGRTKLIFSIKLVRTFTPSLDLPYPWLWRSAVTYLLNWRTQFHETMPQFHSLYGPPSVPSFMKWYPISLTLWAIVSTQFHETIPNFTHFMGHRQIWGWSMD